MRHGPRIEETRAAAPGYAGSVEPAEALEIGLISSDFLPNIGGIAAHVNGLAEALGRLGHAVDVVVPGSRWPFTGESVAREQGSGYRVIRIQAPRVPKLTRFYFARWVSRRIADVRGGRGYDVVHWHTPVREGLVAERIPSKVRVFTNHTSQFLEWERDGEDRELARAVIAPAHGVISPSQELTHATVSAGFDSSRTWTIPNGVDPVRFSPKVDGRKVRERHGIAATDLVVLCPRRLERKNGVVHWLRALPEVISRLGESSPVRFLLVGDYLLDDQYSDRANVLRLISELGLGDRLTWVPGVPNQEMPQYFAASDMAVLPSLMEATSIAGLEAMACGLPLVATNVGGIPEIVRHGTTGLLVDAASPKALAEGMATLLVDGERMRQFGKMARAVVEESYSWEAVARSTVEVYRSLTSLQSSASPT